MNENIKKLIGGLGILIITVAMGVMCGLLFNVAVISEVADNEPVKADLKNIVREEVTVSSPFNIVKKENRLESKVREKQYLTNDGLNDMVMLSETNIEDMPSSIQKTNAISYEDVYEDEDAEYTLVPLEYETEEIYTENQESEYSEEQTDGTEKVFIEEDVTESEEITEEVIVEETYSEEESDETYTETDAYYWAGSVLTPSAGINYGPSGLETYYNLPMEGVISIMRNMGYSEEEYPYWIRDDGVRMLGGYVMVAAEFSQYPRGSVVPSSLGTALVCDTGAGGYDWLDIAVTW